MRKIWVIATREYLAAVRTKAFLISLLVLPLMMGGSILLQILLRGFVDLGDKKFVLVDHTQSSEIVQLIESRVANYNETKISDPQTNQQLQPRFVIARVVRVTPTDDQEKLGRQRLELSEDVRAGKIIGFLEIVRSPAKDQPDRLTLRYQSNRATDNEFADLVKNILSESVRGKLAQEAKLSAAQVREIVKPLDYENKGLAQRNPLTGKVEDAPEESRLVSIIVPVCLMMFMFMVIMMTATPLMQGVVEEKMQRIAEVLLGSVRPFELMFGKLLGMVAVSLTVGALYLGTTYWAAQRFGFLEYLSIDLLLWFVVYQTLAALMFGSMFIAIGAACTDMKETQNLLWPVMLLACFPLFLLGNVLREPNSSLAQCMSLIPFATPTLMIARQAIPPGPQWWEPIVGISLVLITTVACVYAAGRIFRVGLLVQGKGAKVGDILKWIVRG